MNKLSFPIILRNPDSILAWHLGWKGQEQNKYDLNGTTELQGINALMTYNSSNHTPFSL